MPRAVSLVFGFLLSLLRRRFVQVILWFLVALYGLDQLIFSLTQRQWFASLGYENLWRARLVSQAQLFAYFLLLCAVLTRLFLGAVLHPPSGAAALRGALARFEPLRHRVGRLAWALCLLSSFWLATRFAQNWSVWLFLQGGASTDFLAFGNVPATLWTHVLPLLEPFLRTLWLFSLLLFCVVVVAGTLRALPVLASREPSPALALPRILWGMAGWLLVVRASLYGVQVLNLNRGRPLESGDVFVSLPLFVIGALACVVLAGSCWRRARRLAVPQKWFRLAIGIAAAFFLPGLLNFLGSRLRAALPETAWLRQERLHATRAAWKSDVVLPPAPPTASQSVAAEKAWPVWDESSILRALSGASVRNGQIPVWQSATLDFENGRWSALAAGIPAGSLVWGASRETGKSTQIAIERFEFGATTGTLTRRAVAAPQSFFGFEGGSLFTDASFGVPINSSASKWLWAWRLRDLLLPSESSGASHLLTVRGARQRAHELAPFWKVAGQPQLFLDGGIPVWMLDLSATSTDFPGAMPVTEGELAGVNAASDSIRMLMNARTGAVTFYAATPSASGPDGLVRSWQNALPGVLKRPAAMPAALQNRWRASPAWLRAQLDVEEALQNRRNASRLGPSVGLDNAGKVVWRLLSVGKTGWTSLEAPRGHPTTLTLRRGEGDFEARLAAIDREVAKVVRGSAQASVEPGPAVMWSDPKAPGGWWIGRAFFARPKAQQEAGPLSGGGPKLWRMALTGSAPSSPVTVLMPGEGSTPEDAQLQRTAATPAKAEAPLTVQALQAHEAIQKAAKSSDWVAFGRESARLKEVLEKMATPTPVPTATPQPTATVAPSPTPAATPAITPTPLATGTPIPTGTPSAAGTPTPTGTPTTSVVPSQALTPPTRRVGTTRRLRTQRRVRATRSPVRTRRLRARPRAQAQVTRRPVRTRRLRATRRARVTPKAKVVPKTTVR